MTPRFIDASAERRLDWLALADALLAGHGLPRAETRDTVLRRGADTILSRAAWIDGLGALVKTATVFPLNRDAPTINGAVALFHDGDGTLAAMLDFHLVTKWKTAGDSLLAARCLARPDSRRILLVGSGTVAASLREAYAALFPEARFAVWSRDAAHARRFAAAHGAEPAPDLERAVGEADIVATATMATEPIVRGAWLRPGQHLDLVGAYRADMREVDDEALRRARIFVDCRDTTLDHIGELRDPIARGVVAAGDVVADFYDGDRFRREGDDEITISKNGGGAHLDLMTARHILDRIA